MRVTLCSLALTLIFPLAFFSTSNRRKLTQRSSRSGSEAIATIQNINTVKALAPSHKKAQIKRLALGKNAFIGELSIQPGARVPVHRDPTEEYLYVLSGGGTMTLNGTVHTVNEGDVFYMPAGAEVSFVNGNSVTRVLQVFAGPSPASNTMAGHRSHPRSAQSATKIQPIRLYPHLMRFPLSAKAPPNSSDQQAGSSRRYLSF